MIKMFKFWVFVCLTVPMFSQAHPDGTSKIEIKIHPEFIETRIDVNKDDILNAITRKALYTLTEEERKRVPDQVKLYMESRISLEIDGEPLFNPSLLSWSNTVETETDTTYVESDTLDLSKGTYVANLSWTKKPGGKMMRFSVHLFPEFVSNCISNTRVFWNDQEVKQQYLLPNHELWLHINPDSLTQTIARKNSPEEAKKESNFIEFTWFGFLHILPWGLDHILFVIGLFFYSTRFKPLLAQVTAFTIAHSITLGLSLFGIFSLSGKIVEPLIALSISFVAFENIFSKKEVGERSMKPWRWIIVFGFGLLHGLGFAGALTDLGVPEGSFLSTLIGFNLGVEFGQLAVIGCAAVITGLFWKQKWYFKGIVIPASLLIGLVGLYWTVQRIFF